MNYVVGVFLLVEAVRDFCTKRISLWSCLVFGGCSLGYSIIMARDFSEFLWAEIPGVFCLILSFCTKQAIGYGDGILLCAMGMFYDIRSLMFILLVGIVFLVLLD